MVARTAVLSAKPAVAILPRIKKHTNAAQQYPGRYQALGK